MTKKTFCQICGRICHSLSPFDKVIGPIWCIDCSEEATRENVTPILCKIIPIDEDAE